MKRDRSMLGLRWCGKSWNIRLRYPKPLEDATGRRWYSRGSGTADLKEAQALRDRIKSEMVMKARRLEQATKATLRERETVLLDELKDLTQQADKTWSKYEQKYVGVPVETWGPKAMQDVALKKLEGHLETLQTEAETRGVEWFRRVTGKFTPVDARVDQWCREMNVRPVTEEARRMAIARFAKYTDKSMEQLTRRDAGEYVAHLLSLGLSSGTIGQYVGKLSAYWKWHVKRGLIDGVNIWEHQGVRKNDKIERDMWTASELRDLIDRCTSKRLRDAILILAHTGLRADEVCKLTKADCFGGLIEVREGKTRSAKRIIPQHSAIQSLILERCRDKDQGEYLLEEFRGNGRLLSKEFSLYRTSIFGPSEKAQATKTLHSTRHFVKTTMLAKGAREIVVDELLGHAHPGMSSRYHHGAEIAELRAAIEMIKF